MSRFALGLALGLAAAPALAEEPVCEMRGAIAIPVLEAAKRAFLDTDFERFLDLGTALMQDKRDVLEGPLVRLKMIAPGGFASAGTAWCAGTRPRSARGGRTVRTPTCTTDETRPICSNRVSTMRVW